MRERYWKKVALPTGDNVLDDSACWIWTGAISGRGHGRFWIADGVIIIAHRFAFALATDDAEQAIVSQIPTQSISPGMGALVT